MKPANTTFLKCLRKVIAAVLAPLLAVSFNCAAGAQESDAPGALANLLNALPVVYRNNFIELRSDGPVGETEKLAARLSDVFAFDLKLQNLEGNAACRMPLVVGLASQEMIDRYIHTKMGGRALGARGFVSHIDGFVGTTSSYEWYVAAHEFEHVLMARLKATQPALPTYLVEGIAVAVGARFVRSTGMGAAALSMQSRKLANVSGEEAREIFSKFAVAGDIATTRAQGRLFVVENIGGLFVEFLATRKSASPEVFFRNWAKFAAELGAGAQFEASFARHFGISLSAAQSQFVAYMTSTEGNPQARFSGTVYQGYPN